MCGALEKEGKAVELGISEEILPLGMPASLPPRRPLPKVWDNRPPLEKQLAATAPGRCPQGRLGLPQQRASPCWELLLGRELGVASEGCRPAGERPGSRLCVPITDFALETGDMKSC